MSAARGGGVKWPLGIAKFSSQDVFDTRKIIRAVIERCRRERAFVLLSLPKSGADGGDAVLSRVAKSVFKQDEEVVVEGSPSDKQPGWSVRFALGEAVGCAQQSDGGGGGSGGGGGAGGGSDGGGGGSAIAGSGKRGRTDAAANAGALLDTLKKGRR